MSSTDMQRGEYVYLVDTQGMTPEEHALAKAHVETFGIPYTTPKSDYRAPRYFFISHYPPDEFASLPHPSNFPWQDITGRDVTKL